MSKPPPKLGLWLIGAGGNIAATVAVGLAALKQKRCAPTGLLTESPPLSRLPLVKPADIILGGHEISERSPVKTAADLHSKSGIFSELLIRKTLPTLKAFAREIRTGTSSGAGAMIERLATRTADGSRRSGRAHIESIRRDLRSFTHRHHLARMEVINLASTEPIFHRRPEHASWPALNRALTKPRSVLPASSLYAIAAIEEAMPYINFTPSLGGNVPAIIEYAQARRVPIMGADGKTGETLLKCVLAPMFRDRNLRVLSWTGSNILGNRDGQTLSSPLNKAAKLRTKDQVLGSILGYAPQTHTAIEFVESLDDWKTAWDHIHFEGFLGTRMALQFLWQGCDSVLAAPLVIDLARLADYHARAGGFGVMAHLACFFKDPMACAEHDFSRQVKMLQDYAAARTRGKRR